MSTANVGRIRAAGKLLQLIPYRKKFRRTKYFLGQNFQHQAGISTILSDEVLSDKVFLFILRCVESTILLLLKITQYTISLQYCFLLTFLSLTNIMPKFQLVIADFDMLKSSLTILKFKVSNFMIKSFSHIQDK